jgi:hypothetical protein
LGGGKPTRSNRIRNRIPKTPNERIKELESYSDDINRILNQPLDNLSSQDVIGVQSELQEWLKILPEILKTKIDLIKTALEEERAGETIRINGTLKVIVNGLITRLEGLRSDHLVELISFLKNYTP